LHVRGMVLKYYFRPKSRIVCVGVLKTVTRQLLMEFVGKQTL
jgi:hypothetical protein